MFTFAGNWNNTEVDKRNPQITNDLRAAQIENTDPEFRFTLTADHSWGPWRLITRLHYYDDFKDFPLFRPTNPVHAHARALLDLEASYTFFNGVTLAVGAQNLLDIYPTQKQVFRPPRHEIPSRLSVWIQRRILLSAGGFRVG